MTFLHYFCTIITLHILCFYDLFQILLLFGLNFISMKYTIYVFMYVFMCLCRPYLWLDGWRAHVILYC